MNMHGKLLRAAVAAALFASVTASWAGGFGKPVIASPATGGTFQRLNGNMPPALGQARYLQAHNPNEVLSLTVALKLQNSAQLAAFLRDVQNPRSPQYHHFLSAAQTTALYSPSMAQLNAVTSYLNSQGIKVSDVSADRLLVHASAPTVTLQHAFGVNISDYSLNGQSFYSPDNNPRLRADIAPMVVAVMGLDNSVELQPHLVAAPTVAPSPATVAGGIGPSGYSPQQIAATYNWPDITNTNNGKNVTIGIATAFTYRISDIQTFWSAYKLPTHTVTGVAIDGVTRRINDETTLDIEHSSAMAPGAAIIVYSGVNPQFTTFVDVFDRIKTDNTAQVVSTSWGSCEAGTPTASMAAEDSLFILMVAQGQSLWAAAGDGGSADRCGANSLTDNADFPSSDPNMGAAGGTRLVLNGNGTVNSETAWISGGGADSVLFAQPAYETSTSGWVANTSCSADTNTTDSINVSTACLAAGNASRKSSDLSMDADPGTPYSFFFNGRWGQAGGTSFVAPELAGLFAIIVGKTGSVVKLGSAPAQIYPDAGCNTTDVRDITSGNNGAFSAGTGWDHPTGWGVPRATNLLGDLPYAGC